MTLGLDFFLLRLGTKNIMKWSLRSSSMVPLTILVSLLLVSRYVVNERVCGIMNSSGSKVCLYETRVSYIRQVLCGSMIFSVKVEKVYIRVKEHKGINTSIAKVS